MFAITTQTRFRAALIVALLSCVSCSRCGTPPAHDAAELLPAVWTSAMSTAPLGQVATRTSALAQLAAQLPGGESVGETIRALSGQLGVDLLSRDGLIAVGLDPERGAALVLLEPLAPSSHAPWLVALPLANAEQFAQRLETVLSGRAGLPERSDESRGKIHCVVFAKRGVTERVAYAVVRGYGLIARASDPSAMIADAAARPLEQSLARDPRLVRAATELEHPDLLLLSARGNPLLARLAATLAGPAAAHAPAGDAAIGLALLPDGARLQLSQDLENSSRDQLRALFALPPGQTTAEIFQTPQAPLELRANIAAGALAPLASRVPLLRDALVQLRGEFSKHGADLDRDLFAALSPGVAFALDLAPRANLGRALDPALLDLRTRSPFDIVRLYATAGARDPVAAARGFAALAQALPSLGATAMRTAEKKPVQGGLLDEWASHYAGGEGVRFGVFVPGRDLCGPSAAARTQALVYAIGGAGSLEDVLAAHLDCARVANGEPAVSSTPAPLQLRLDLGALADAINKLPDSAYGTGPQVFVARSLVSQVIVPLQRLRASAQARPGERGVLATVRVQIAPASAP